MFVTTISSVKKWIYRVYLIPNMHLVTIDERINYEKKNYYNYHDVLYATYGLIVSLFQYC